MPKTVAPLNDTQVKNAKPREKDYLLSDGSGLYLNVKSIGSKVWTIRYTFNGKQRKTTIGNYPYVTLQQAREKNREYQTKAKQDINPVKERKEAKKEAQKQELTFEMIAQEFIGKKQKEGKSDKYITSIKSKLSTYIYPLIGKTPMSTIKRADVMEALKIADRKSPHSAKSALQYTKAIFTYAENMGYIDFSVISSVVAKNVLTKIEHKNFKHITDKKRFGELLKAIDDYKGEFVTRQLLRFMPLVMTRPTEARLARWSEIDFKNEIWTIPAERMKMRNDHIVPLSKQAIAILKEVQPFTGHRELVFASCYGGNKMMSENTVNNALKRIGFGDEQTGHGFRHTASTLLHEAINEHGAHSLVIEACLAHKDTNEIRAVYNKAQYIE
ncbi:MAG TPA: tyrosine-type recombinase/integrase, partial [Campylobacterales bacterium]|nr:tyrosine-type recombinase/integrase [Campylobacterales bacterium]